MNSFNLIDPKRDIVFKRIFGTRGNEGILKDFLESILEIEIESLTLDLNTEIVPESFGGKTSRIDVLTKLSSGTLVDIEVQMDPNKFSEERCLKYWSDVYSRSAKKGSEYGKLNKTIGIWIVDGSVYPNFEKYDTKWKMHECELKIRAFDNIEIHVIEYSKFRTSAIIEPKKKEFWLWFIDHTNKELVEMSCIDNERIKEARKQLDEIYADEKLRFALMRQEWDEMDYNTDIARAKREGKAEGEKEKAKQVAQKLKATGMPISQIAEITELTEEEIEKL